MSENTYRGNKAKNRGTSQSSHDEEGPRKRGRPRKEKPPVDESQKRKRGRPRKIDSLSLS